MNIFNRFIKRAMDVVLSFIGLIIILPIMVIFSILIKIDSEGPIFFKQIRVGLRGKKFKILKFRTMVVNAEKLGQQITIGEDNRITRVGKFIRKYKIDELPQLINVFKGDMSLVGPRPEVTKYVELYNEEQSKVLSVRPGITDLASIRYSDENEILGKVSNPEEYYTNTIMPDKLDLNLQYINNNNIIKDLVIIFKTIFKVLR